MLFNSIEFAVYLPIVFSLYWFITRSIKARNALLLVASYVFYGWWDWRFLSLIIFSSILDFSVGIGLSKTDNKFQRKCLLLLSILANVGLLGFFKYFNFFVDSFSQAFTLLGQPIETTSLNIILPVGISFYTFQTLSYSIDVFKRKMDPATDIVAYFAYVSFFAQLVAGPIERATNLLPQFYKQRTFDYQTAVQGMRQILWGLFKKVVVADNCAGYVNDVFSNYENYSGSTLINGAVLFSFQIYGDFSGYSDIAIGTGKLFGIRLMKNFANPYFSRDIAEFWRRWHISLSTWFRDYVYIPMGGSRGTTWSKVRNTFVIFLVSGFWHGANWTFIVWGGLNALFFIPLLLSRRNRNHLDVVASGRSFPSLQECSKMLATFGLTTVAWVFFRAETVGHAFLYLKGMFSASIFTVPDLDLWKTGVVTLSMVLIEWIARTKPFALADLELSYSRPVRWSFYLLISLSIFYLGSFENHTFIYFQF